MNRENSALAEAGDIIYGDREKTYGHPAKNLEAIADLWVVHLRQRFGHVLDLGPKDVAAMMVLLKMARLGHDMSYRDNITDGIGYLALIERCDEPAGAVAELAANMAVDIGNFSGNSSR